MKYTIFGFQQQVFINLHPQKKLDITDAAILRWFIDFKNTEKMKELIVNDEVFSWVYYQQVIDDLPSLGITNREVIARRFKKLEEAKILFKHVEKKNGTYTYYRINKKVFSQLIEHPTQKSSDGTKPPENPVPPDSKVDPHPIQKSDATRLKSRDKDSSIIDSSINNSLLSQSDLRKDLHNKIKNFFEAGYASFEGEKYYHDGKEAKAIDNIIKRSAAGGKPYDEAQREIGTKAKVLYENIKCPPNDFWSEQKYLPSTLLSMWNKLTPSRPKTPKSQQKPDMSYYEQLEAKYRGIDI